MRRRTESTGYLTEMRYDVAKGCFAAVTVRQPFLDYAGKDIAEPRLGESAGNVPGKGSLADCCGQQPLDKCGKRELW